jgi:adenosine deaminase
VLAEYRIAPLLFECMGSVAKRRSKRCSKAWAQSALPSGLIVCAMRHLPPTETLRAAQLALRYQGRGVVGFDLAGPGTRSSAREHIERCACCWSGLAR